MEKQRLRQIKKRVYDLINIGDRSDIPSRICNYIIVAAIAVNLIILILGTFSIPFDVRNQMKAVEYVTLAVFVIEFALRIWTAEILYPGLPRLQGIIKFIFSFYGQIDLWSILPYFIPLFLPTGLVALRALRIFRVFRLFRVNASYDAFNVVLDVLNEKKNQIASSMCLIFICMMASSLLMYSVEHGAQPAVYKNAFSGLWWSVSAMFTVGYGDIYPITPFGQVLAIIISTMGVGLVAIPTGIISAGFVEQYSKMKSLTEASEDSPVNFIQFTLEEGHPWVGKALKDIVLAPELIFVAVIREDNVIIPRGTTRLCQDDILILSAIEFQGDIGIKVREVTILEGHPWKDKRVRDINIPEAVVLVSVVRHNKPFLPKGDTILRFRDQVILCAKQ